MTREKALNIVGELVVYARTQNWDDKYTEAFEALSVEPCEDAISRQATLEKFQKTYFDNQTVIRCAELVLEGMSPVTPQPKMGEWLCSDDIYGQAVCSLCKENLGEPFGYAKKYFKYCPNCSAKMG